MINKKTVFVLGAGASAPYGFPTGVELRRLIIDNASQKLSTLNKDSFRRDDFIKHGKIFSQKFKDSGVNSIDRFLNEQEENFVVLGKILIMAFIRECEKNSEFNENIKNSNMDWYRQFWNHLIKGVKDFDNLTFENFKIITFNYDRSLEYFLYKCARNLYPISKVSDEKIMNLMRTLDIEHVFGKVENMIWDSPGTFDEQNVHRYYCNLYYDYNVLLQKISSIKIINEVQSETNKYKEMIEGTEEVYFLGFGFLEENMEILGAPFEKKSAIHTRYLSTAKGCSKENIEKYFQKYFSKANYVNNIIDCDCCTLLKNHLE